MCCRVGVCLVVLCFDFKTRNLGAEMFWVPQFAPWFCVLKISRRKFVLFIWPDSNLWRPGYHVLIASFAVKDTLLNQLIECVAHTFFFVYLGFYLIIRYTVTKEMMFFKALFDWSKRQNTDYSVENDIKGQIYIYFDVTKLYFSVLAKACCSCRLCRHSWVQALHSTHCEPMCDYISFYN